MSDSFLKLQEMCSFSQNVCIEVYAIFITRRTPILGVRYTFRGLFQPLVKILCILLLSFTLENQKSYINIAFSENYAENVLRMHVSSI